MAEIDVGNNSGLTWYLDDQVSTLLVRYNPANANGILTDIYLNMGGYIYDVKLGTMYGSNLTWQCRESVSVGNLDSGKQTISGLSIDVKENDCIAIYVYTRASFHTIGYTTTPDYNTNVYSGDALTGDEITFSSGYANKSAIMYGTGQTTPAVATKTIGIKIGNLSVNKISILESTGWTEGKIN